MRPTLYFASSMILMSVCVTPICTADTPRPFDSAVRNEGFLPRATPSSSSLIGFVYRDRNVGPGVVVLRSTECFSREFLNKLNDPDHRQQLSAEARVRMKGHSLDVSTFLKLGNKQGGRQTDTSDAEATLHKEGIETVVVEMKDAFAQDFSSEEVRQNVEKGCSDKVLDPHHWIILGAFGVSSLDYVFAKQDGTKVTASGRVREILKSTFGLTDDQLNLGMLHFEEPRYLGYKIAHWNPKTGEFTVEEKVGRKKKS